MKLGDVEIQTGSGLSCTVVIVVVLLVAAAIGGLAYYFGRGDAPPPRVVTRTVTQTVFQALEPDTVVRWRERILTVERPVTEVVIAPGAGVENVDGFCGAAGFVRPDSAPAVEPTQMLAYAEEYDGETLSTFTIDNAGNKRLVSATDVDDPWHWTINGLERTVYSSRWADLRVALQYGAVAVGGVELGRISCGRFP